MDIIIENDGQDIAATNYWALAMEEAGKLYVSVNAGAIRVLVPRALRRIIVDMRTAEYCILSRGPWPRMELQEAVEIIWEDMSDNPFALHLSPESFDLLPAEPPAGRDWVCSVWECRKGKPHKALERLCHWRRVASLPCLKPWKG
ncbi:MAG: hypothetical protein GX547_16275 [Phycisphaerae bacterium]|nr:hypothetical protein [Phycisphaerae bacterium]